MTWCRVTHTGGCGETAWYFEDPEVWIQMNREAVLYVTTEPGSEQPQFKHPLEHSHLVCSTCGEHAGMMDTDLPELAKERSLAKVRALP